MEWLQKLRPASFRGVPFAVDGSDRAGGRRTVEHVIPGRDYPIVEDRGRTAGRFSLEGFVAGGDYLERKDRLIAALELPGAGILVHPYFGNRRVQLIEGYRVAENPGEAGLARFTMEFVEVADAPPEVAGDPVGDVDAASDALKGQAVEDFAGDIVAEGQPEWVLSTARGDLTSLSGLLKRTGLASAAQAAADFARRADALSDSVLEKLADPFPLGREIRQLIEDVDQTISGKLELFDVYRRNLFNFTPRTLSGDSIFRRRSRQNSEAISRLVRATALGQAASVAARVDWDSYDDAVGARDQMLDAIDSLQESVSDALYLALEALRARVVVALPPEEEELPRLTTVTPDATQPSLVLAYRLYGSTDLAGDVVARNRISNPVFVAAREPLEVLSIG